MFELSGDSAAGPDGFTGKFFSACWDIIGEDLHRATLEFFAGFPLPRSWTSILIATIPKVESPMSFKDLRPICLCNFCNKVLSKLLSTRLAKILPHIIILYLATRVLSRKGKSTTIMCFWRKN